jgi:diguanylate cyclase (GGDEF)-like protein
MLDLAKAESFIRKSGERKREVAYSRLGWFLAFMVFLLVDGGVDWGDLILLGFLQLVFYLILYLPEQQAKGHLRLQALAVVDFIFLVLGLGMTQNSSVAVLLFLAAYYLACYFSRNLRTLAGIALLFTGMVLVLGFQDWFHWSSFLSSLGIGQLLLLVLLLLSLAVYLAFLGLPGNPLLNAYERYRGALHNRKMLLEMMERIANCRSLREILVECISALGDGIPGCQVDVIQITEKKGGIWNPLEPDVVKDEFSIENIPNLKKAVTTRETVMAQYSAEPKRGKAGKEGATTGEAWSEVYFPAHYEPEKERGYCFRLILTHRSLMEEEKDLIQAVRECSALAIRHVVSEESMLVERRDLAGRLQQSQREILTLSAMRDLLARLNIVQELDACLDATHQVLHQVVGHDSLLLFFPSAGGSLMELVDLRSRIPLLMNRGFALPAANTLVGDAIRKRKITYKSSVKVGEIPEAGPDDVHHYVRNNLGSLFIMPLSEVEDAHPYGALIIAHHQAGHFSMDQMDVLAQLQGALGFGIRRCLVHHSQARKLVEADAIQALGLVITAEPTPDSMAREIGSTLERTVHYDQCQVFLYDPSAEELYIPSSETEAETVERTAISVRAKDFVAHVYRTRNGHLTGNTAKDQYSTEADSMSASRIAVPIVFNEEVLGVLDAVCYRENAFSEADLRFLTFVATVASQALANTRMAQKFQRQLAIDPLTGLCNRQYLLERLEAELAQHIRRHEPLALLLADIDGMEQLNETYGFGVGDQILRRVADVVRAHCRKGDVPARWDGDSLGLILVGADLSYALKLGQKVGEAIRKQPELQSHKVTLSAGVAAFPQHGQTATAVITACRQSLAKAREQGPGSLAYPETETLLINGKSFQLNTATLYSEVLGSARASGPHTRETLAALLGRLQQMGCDAGLLGDVLLRLVTRLDYPERHQEILTTLPELVRRLGAEMNLSEQKIRYLLLAYKIYDVGKFSIPQDILYAPRALNEAERQLVMNHVSVAVQDILNPHKVFAPLLAIIKFHHERWDGSGYPWKLKQEEIPLEARIIGLVDVFKALATDRPYRPRRPLPEVLVSLRQMRGSLFEAELVDALLRVVEDLKIA